MKNPMMLGLAVLGMLMPAATQLAPSHGTTHATPQPVSVTARPVGRPVARVNGAVLTDLDLAREEYTIFPYARQHNGDIPAQMEPGIRKGAMQMIVFEELVYQEALRRNIVVPSALLQRAEADFKKQFASPAVYRSALQVEFQGSEAKLWQKIRRSILIDRYLEVEVNHKSVATPVELKSFYSKNANKYQYPESFSLQTISFLPPPKATPAQLAEARKRAETALPKARAAKTAEEFGLLAEKVSEDDYRVMMGSHPLTDRAQLAPNLVEKLLKMQPGQVTDIVQVEQIFTIVRLDKHVPAAKRPFRAVQAEIKKEVELAKTNQIRAALDKKLRQTAKIEVL